jgi:cell volume regulation protein A
MTTASYPSLELIFLGGALLVILSVFASKISDRFSIPALAIFLLIGMLAGSEGIGGIYFNNAFLAKSLGIAALSFILFSGALETERESLQAVLKEGISLSTVGVLITALIVGVFAVEFLKFSFIEGLLLGAIISATDAAAVFSILRSRNLGLRGRLKPLLEFESGSNDPMSVFLTVLLIDMAQNPSYSGIDALLFFLKQFAIGTAAGLAMARLIATVINQIKLQYEGLYPVLTFALVVFTYAITAVMGGNGFLAVYLAGLSLSGKVFLHKKNLMHFHEGLAWLMQIAMFLTLGLLVFPSHLIPVAGIGLATAAVLMFIARPIAVFVALFFARMSVREKFMVSWVGLRGAAPIVLATFPLLAGLPKAEMIFNVVFFIVLVSVLVQGASLPLVAQWLGVHSPWRKRRKSPLEFERTESVEAELMEFIVPFGGKVVGKALYELGLPQDSLVVLICREEKFIIVRGSTRIQEGDVLWVLVGKKSLGAVTSIVCAAGDRGAAGEKSA